MFPKQTYEQNQTDLQTKSNEKMQAIADKVREVVKAIGDAGGYVYIMDTTSGIPYISTTLSTDVHSGGLPGLSAEPQPP